MNDGLDSGGPSFGPQELALVLERGWKKIALGALLGLAAGLALSFLLPSKFVSTAKLVFEPAALPTEYVRTTVSERGAEEQRVFRQRLTSDAVLLDVVERAGDVIDPKAEMHPTQLIRDIRQNLGLEVTNGSRTRGTQVIALSYSAADPHLASHVLTSLIEAFTTSQSDQRTREARATERFLSVEVERVGADLDVLEAEVLAARSKLPRDLIFGSKSAVVPPAPRRTESATLQRLREELARVEALYTAEHPTVQNVRRQYEALKRRSRPVGTAKTNAKRADSEELENLARYDAIHAEHARVEESYEKLVGRHLDALVAANLEIERAGSRFRELQTPTLPSKASFPDPLLFTAAGAVAGTGIVLMLLLGSVWWRPSYGNLAGLEEMLDLPVIACIPHVDTDELVQQPPPPGLAPRIVSFTAPDSVAAEQYRSFIPHYLDEKQPRIVLVTSSTRGDGKSMTSANLAATLALELGNPVLLVDADLRRPSSHRLFGMSRRPGLADVLAGTTTLEQCVRPTQVPQLSLLPAGAPASIRIARFAGARFMQFLDAARSRYGTIILDTPPIIPVADARLLGRISEMVLLVVRANKTPRDSVDRCLDALGDVSGLIFNDVSAGSYYRAYHSYPTDSYGSD